MHGGFRWGPRCPGLNPDLGMPGHAIYPWDVHRVLTDGGHRIKGGLIPFFPCADSRQPQILEYGEEKTSQLVMASKYSFPTATLHGLVKITSPLVHPSGSSPLGFVRPGESRFCVEKNRQRSQFQTCSCLSFLLNVSRGLESCETFWFRFGQQSSNLLFKKCTNDNYFKGGV